MIINNEYIIDGIKWGANFKCPISCLFAQRKNKTGI